MTVTNNITDYGKYLYFLKSDWHKILIVRKKKTWSLQRDTFINKTKILFYSLEALQMHETQSQYIQELLQNRLLIF